MKYVLRLLPTLALFIGLTLPAQSARADEIGYVNLARALLEVNEGQRAMEKIKKTFDKKQAELLSKESELKKLKDTLDKEIGGKTDPASMAKQAEFEAKVMELQQTLQNEQMELERMKATELKGIKDKMQAIIEEIGKGGGYSIILEIQDSRLLFAKPHLDLTNELIRKYNQKYK
ncbi:MAG: OmpH family outer membrane protein [Myxococcales bacterium]|nr:OmpH family outer membrane protein [Myxococcales bacterium]MCB9646096.1 OmpH family outer membrane protein [Deltaproteobacteria bacterium]